MKKIFAMAIIGFLCISMISIITPKVMGWAFGLHGAMANDALTGMGWSNQVGTYANDVDLYFPHPGSSNHRVGKYQVLYQNLGGDPCNYQGAEYWARIYIASARNSYLSNNMADAEMYLGYAIHYIEDAVCPPHVFPFSEEFIWWAPLSWQLVSLETAPHANFEAETLVGYGIKNWPSLVRNAEPSLIADLSDLETKIVQAADRVYALPCDYVRQNDHPIADDNDVVGDPSHVTGWSMLDENIGKCMVEAASLVKGAAIYVRVGAGVVPPEVVCVPFHGMLLGVPHDAWIGKEIILKGTAHDPDGDSTLAAYKWDFGDGYSTNWIAGVNAYVIEARHTYTGTMADGTPYDAGKYFTAWLHVKDNDGLEGKDSYFIGIREKTLDVEVNVAIDNGLWWLHKEQSRGAYGDGAEYGYWPSSYGFNVAFAGACTEAFELQGHLPSGDRNEDPYVETVQRGLNYLFNNCGTYSIGQDPTYCPLGNPDTNGNGIGLACTTYSGEILYEAGIALMAISSSGTPNRVATTGSPNVVGRTYKDIAQDMVDWIAWGQSDPYTGVYEGGWRYTANYGVSDNSVSQWPVIGMEAAERNFGSAVTIPSFVRPELAKWLSYSQNSNGGFGYTTPWEWVNTAKTGAGCAMLSWAGVPTTDARFQNALAFLDANWYYSGYTYTNFGDYYTMYAIMKGMRIPHPNVESIGTHDWYAEYARYIIDQQNSYGGEYVVDHSWLSSYVDGTLATAWALATLTLTVTTPGPVAEAGSNVDNYPPTIPVKFDASDSYHRDPAKSIVLYEWDFDSDGTWDYSGTDLKVEHAYPAYTNPDGSIDWSKTAKDYTATLRVTDNSDPVLQDTDTCIIHITAPPWKPVADPNGPYEGFTGAPIHLDGSTSYDPESKMYPSDHPWYETIAKYEWDLDNDGQFDDSTEIRPWYTWDTKGTYSVGLKVTDTQPSGPGDTVGSLDVDMKYTTVIIKQSKEYKVAYLSVKYSDTSDQDVLAHPISWVGGNASLVEQYFWSQSFGSTRIVSDVKFSVWQNLQKSFADYGPPPEQPGTILDVLAWLKIADDAIKLAGIDESYYDAIVVIQPKSVRAFTEPTLTGIGKKVMVDWDLFNNGYRVIAHELGHALLKFADYYGEAQDWKTDWIKNLFRGGDVKDWCLMGGGNWLNPPAPIMSWNKINAGWLRKNYVDFGEHSIKLVQDLNYNDEVTFFTKTLQINIPGTIPIWITKDFILEGRYPADGVTPTDPSSWEFSLTKEKGVELYQVVSPYSVFPKVYATAHDNSDYYTATLLPNDLYTYEDDIFGVKISAFEKNNEIYAKIEPHSVLDHIVAWVQNIEFRVPELSQIQSSSLPSEDLDIDLRAYTNDGKIVGMDYALGKYKLEIAGAGASGNTPGCGPEWISLPLGMEDITRFEIDPTPALGIATQHGFSLADLKVTLQVLCYDSEGNLIGSQPAIIEQLGSAQKFSFALVQNPDGTYTPVLDNTPPAITVVTPSEGTALQDGVTLKAVVTDPSGVDCVTFSIRDPNGEYGNVIDPIFEDMSATYVGDDTWQLPFNTNQPKLPDGYYLLLAKANDTLGNEGHEAVPFSIRNWATIQLLPSTPSSKAGRTMPVKFSIRVKASVDPAQPFIYNEELTIKIYKIASPSNVLLQTSTFGSGSTNYRIDPGKLYITNFKTLSTPATYLVKVYRKDLPIGSFQFSTVK